VLVSKLSLLFSKRAATCNRKNPQIKTKERAHICGTVSSYVH